MTDLLLKFRYLDAMGIEVWRQRAAHAVNANHADALSPNEVRPASQVLDDVATLDWNELAARVAACTLCGLQTTRTRTVFGVGDLSAEWLVVGEAPGAEEDKQGEPFVGRAGRLLNAMLFAIGLKREQVYIANILKCRPPENRDPRPDEVACCEPHLLRQIELVQPKIILAVGRVAAQNLLKTATAIGKLRGQLHHYGPQRLPVVVTYHPAYLLRSPSEKRKAWDDLQFACDVVRQAQSA